MALTLLIVDDHAGFRTFARALLEADGFDVVGEAGDGEAAIRAAMTFSPTSSCSMSCSRTSTGSPSAPGCHDSPRPPAVVLTSSRDASTYRRRLRDPGTWLHPQGELTGAALAALVG